jgi:hypothetical protein
MNNEYNNKFEAPSPEDFWPEAKELLDKHYAAKKKRILFFFASLTILMIAFVLTISEQEVKLASKKVTSETKLKTIAASTNTSLGSTNVNAKSNAVVPQTKAIINKETKSISNQIKLDQNTELVINAAKNENLIENVDEPYQKEAMRVTFENTILTNIEDNRKEIDSNKDYSIIERPNKMEFMPVPVIKYKSVNTSSTFILKENNHIDITTLDDYYSKNKQSNFSIEIYSGIQQNTKRISANQLLTEYADIRNTAEKKINTTYFGFNVSLQRKRLVIQSGIAYHLIGENNQYDAKSKQWIKNDENEWEYYNKQIVKIDTVYHFGIVSYNQTIVNAKDSTLLTKYDSVFVYHNDSNMINANGKTKISYLELPLLLGYQFNSGKFSITPMAGITMGYLLQSNGSYINKSITGIETIHEGKILNAYAFNYLFKLQVAYQFTSHWMVSLLPQYKSNIISVSPKSSGINTKYRSLGASIGLAYKL